MVNKDSEGGEVIYFNALSPHSSEQTDK